MKNKGLLDAKTLACYIKNYYCKNIRNEDISLLKFQKSLYFCFTFWGGFIRKNTKFSDDNKEITFNYSEILFENPIEA